MTVRKLTRAEVAEHNSNKSAWIIIGNKVFDVTKFLDEHPGGCEVLLEKAGDDRTEAFEDVGHSTDAREMKEQFLVGEIVDEERWTYSYDKKYNVDRSADGAQKTSSPLEALVYPGLVVAILALLYYLLMA
ncbi:Protein CYTB-5.1 [Aphelenchoides avenae]|nr:Protein CYTB-5.1 [Aphelenchus avenae]KAH7717362.1 Protein CYTB-5.1 [Aphelenchus avenae]